MGSTDTYEMPSQSVSDFLMIGGLLSHAVFCVKIFNTPHEPLGS